MRHFIDLNRAGALQRLLDFRPHHPYFRHKTTSLLQDEPASLRMRVTKEEEKRFFLAGDLEVSCGAVNDAMKAAFKHRDMSCLQLLTDHGLADYGLLLNKSVDDGFCSSLRHYDWFTPSLPGLDPYAGQNAVLKWLLSFAPRHVVQAMVLMSHPSLQPLGSWRSPIGTQSDDTMLVVAASRGYPSSQQTIHELRMLLGILADDNSGGVIRQPLLNALHVAREIAVKWPDTRPLVANFLQSVCTWVDIPSSSS